MRAPRAEVRLEPEVQAGTRPGANGKRRADRESDRLGGQGAGGRWGLDLGSTSPRCAGGKDGEACLMGPEPGDLSGQPRRAGAGTGQRFSNVEKAFYPVFGRPLLCWAVEVFERAQEIDPVCLVLAGERGARAGLGMGLRLEKVTDVVPGGRERQDSVRAGLKALPGCALMLVHDAPTVGQRGDDPSRAAGTPAGTVRDHCGHTGAGHAQASGRDERPGARHGRPHRLWSAQTRRSSRPVSCRRAFAPRRDQAGAYTDDAPSWRRAGCPVTVSRGAGKHQADLAGRRGPGRALLRTRHAGTVR